MIHSKRERTSKTRNSNMNIGLICAKNSKWQISTDFGRDGCQNPFLESKYHFMVI